ncbi:purine-cytosine permease family protein [Patulibacter americanus]|uniref:purine-cytosine permease family protein n=1 Tax=Patulibacter americanus TaxID=588672 RepID=UPI0003B33231|nr:cytosine permease [Patulibacter americanus]
MTHPETLPPPSAPGARDPDASAPRALRGVEVRSIDYVPEDERHGHVWQQGPFWFLGNFQPFTVAIGLVGPALGLSLWWTILAATLGILSGTLFMAFHASQGPVLGLPQMIQSRAQLGHRGVVIALFGTVFTFVGFNVIDTVIIKEGLSAIYGWDAAIVGLVITVVAVVLAIYGHDWLHRAFQVLLVISFPFWIVLTIAIVTGGIDTPKAVSGDFTFVAFMVQFTVALSYNVTYAPYVSDYSRYLPKDTKTGAIVGAVFGGASLSAIWLIAIGAFLASKLGASDALVGIHDAGNQIAGWVGSVLALLAVAALVATMALNAYSGMLTVITGIDSLRPITPTRRLRVVVILALAVVWSVVGIGLIQSYGTALGDTLIIMLYLLVPWTAVNLVDFFWVRRGHYAITDLFTPTGIYGAWAWRGLVAYAVGLLVTLPFLVTSFYTGFVASWISDIDVSAIVGLAVTAVVYLVLTRSLDVAAEEPAIAASEEALRLALHDGSGTPGGPATTGGSGTTGGPGTTGGSGTTGGATAAPGAPA